jgi:hypothetical protein
VLKDEAAVLSARALLAVREGVEASRVVSMGVLSAVAARLADPAFYRPGGGFAPAPAPAPATARDPAAARTPAAARAPAAGSPPPPCARQRARRAQA